MIRTTVSRHGVCIRLTDERWAHIVEEHAELAGMREDVLQAVADAGKVVGGHAGEKLAWRIMETGKALVVVSERPMTPTVLLLLRS